MKLFPVMRAFRGRSWASSSRRELGLVEVVVLVILRALQRQLEGDAILGDLVDPNTRVHFDRSRVCRACLACLGRCVGLR